jgi:hypothetical protein
MAATKLYVRVSGVTFTYGVSPTTVTIDKVTDVKSNRGGQELDFYGDGAIYPTASKLIKQKRGASVMGGNKAAMESVPLDTFGTLVWIEEDLYNGTGTGARTKTLSNAKAMSYSSDAGESQVGTGSLNFISIATDGITDPLVTTVAS